VVDSEARLLEQAGHEVIRVAHENPSGSVDAAVTFLASPWNLRQAARIGSIARESGAELAHVHNTWFALSPSVVASLHRAGLPVVMSLHNYRLLCANGLLFRGGADCRLCIDGSRWNAVRYRCYRGLGGSVVAALTQTVADGTGVWQHNVDLFLALSERGRQLFGEGGLDTTKVRVKSNFVADPGPRVQAAASSDEVLYVGRLSVEKGVGRLIEAWKSSQPDLKLRVVGEGPLWAELERHRSRHVVFSGHLPREEVSRLMLSSRAIVVPSLAPEGQPMVILEALAAGLPVLAASTLAAVDTIELGTRWVVAGAEGGWVRAMSVLADDQEVAAASRVARRIYEDEFTPQAALQALESCYREAIANHRTHAASRSSLG
jgi:glycosyltransferase involved in cell wall biosynthesis